MHEPFWATLKQKSTGEILQVYIQDIGDYWLSVFPCAVSGINIPYSKKDWEFKILCQGIKANGNI